MKQIKFSFTMMMVFIALLVCAAAAQAQIAHTFVSRTGDDDNNCNAANPCRTFAGAQPKTEGRGDITALDTGLYGPITITKPLTIQAAPGVTATLNPSMKAGSNRNSVSVDTGPSDVVVIRNLSLVTNEAGVNGILITNSGSVHVEGCVTTGFRGENGVGIRAMTARRLFIHDTVIRENGNGVIVDNVSAVIIDHCRIEDNHFVFAAQGQSQTLGFGVAADHSNVNITDSVLTSNVEGIHVGFTAGGSVVSVERCVVSHNSGRGIVLSTGDVPANTIFVSNSTVTDNLYGLFNSGTGSFFSRGNNTIEANGTDIGGTIQTFVGK
jgi:hypothetical protein